MGILNKLLGGRASPSVDDEARMGASDNDEYAAEDESLSVHDAADMWLSNGMDEDYTFGYDLKELRRAAGLD